MNRFDPSEQDLGSSRKVLTERLNHLVDHGILKRRPYDHQPRYEYYLTDRGTGLFDLRMAMAGRATSGSPVPGHRTLYRHHPCDELSHVDLRCDGCGEPMHANDIDVLPGPGAAA